MFLLKWNESRNKREDWHKARVQSYANVVGSIGQIIMGCAVVYIETQEIWQQTW